LNQRGADDPWSLGHHRLQGFRVLDALGVVAQPVAVAQGGVAAAVAGQQRAGEADQRRLERHVAQGLADGAGEVVVFVAGVVGAHEGIIRVARRAGASAPEEGASSGG
jgi:hypothetical protein